MAEDRLISRGPSQKHVIAEIGILFLRHHNRSVIIRHWQIGWLFCDTFSTSLLLLIHSILDQVVDKEDHRRRHQDSESWLYTICSNLYRTVI